MKFCQKEANPKGVHILPVGCAGVFYMPPSSQHKSALLVLALLDEHQYSHTSKVGAEKLSYILCFKTVYSSMGWVLEALEFFGCFWGVCVLLAFFFMYVAVA